MLDHSTTGNLDSTSYYRLFSANPEDNLQIVKLLEEAMMNRVLYLEKD